MDKNIKYLSSYRYTYLFYSLKHIGVKITFYITTLMSGFPLNKFTHIPNFRKQLYISIDDISKLLGSISVSYENITY